MLVASTDLLLLGSSAVGKRGKFEDSDSLVVGGKGCVFRAITVSINVMLAFTLS